MKKSSIKQSISTSPMQEAASQLDHAAAYEKCHYCGCFHDALKTIEKGLTEKNISSVLDRALKEGSSRIKESRYDCLGCKVCFPALALNALSQAGEDLAVELDPCSTEEHERREGWPPLSGDYKVIRYSAPVAVCILNSPDLYRELVNQEVSGISIVGSLRTENLGIERLVKNVLANPNIRFLVLCGQDSHQAIGHCPGQSLLAMAQNGIDKSSRIIGARGKRPILRNISKEAVEHFRQTVEVIDLVGKNHVKEILDKILDCEERNPGQAEPFTPENVVVPLKGYLPQGITLDPAGYFVVYVDRPRKLLLLEHYQNDGVLDRVIESKSAAELYIPAIENELVCRLDHAAYLGRELARAEQALLSGKPYVQDGAPDRSSSSLHTNCGCSSPGSVKTGSSSLD